METTMMRLDQLEPSPENLRQKVRSGQKFKQLVDSVKALGILEPLVVTPNDGKKHIIAAGHRRYEAAKEAGLAEVPVIVRADMTPQQITEAMLVENLQREDLLPSEEATGYMRLVDLGMTKKDLAKRIGRSAAHVGERLRLFDLPAKARGMVDKGDIPVGAVEHLLKLKREDMNDVLEEATGEHVDWPWEVDDYERAVTQRIRDKEAEEKRAKARELAESSGYPVHEFDWSIPGNSKLAALGDGWGDVQVDKRKHRKEPCHALVLLVRAGKTVEACSDPKRHTKDGDSDLKLPAGAKVGRMLTEREKEQRAEQKAKAERTKALRAEVATLFKGKLPADAAQMALKAFVLDANQTQQKAVCALIGVALDPDAKDGQGFPQRAEGPLTAYMDGPAKTAKAAAALAFLVAEETWKGSELRGLVGGWLQAQGVENDFAKDRAAFEAEEAALDVEVEEEGDGDDD